MMAAVEQLPRGRHGLDRHYVRSHQRQRIVEATLALLTEVGFERCTVSAIITRARLSRRTFYEHFDDRVDAVTAAAEATAVTSVPTGLPQLDGAGWRLVRGESA